MNDLKPKEPEIPLPSLVPVIPGGVARAVFRFFSKTYHGNVSDYENRGLPEYGEPIAHVDVAAEPAATVIYLQKGDRQGLDRPGVVIERQTDRWAMFISSEAGGDNELYVYILDDGRIFSSGDAIAPKNLHFSDPPDPTP